jgi:hypothetical protein
MLARVCGGGTGLWGVLDDPSARSFDQLAMNCSMRALHAPYKPPPPALEFDAHHSTRIIGREEQLVS